MATCHLPVEGRQGRRRGLRDSLGIMRVLPYAARPTYAGFWRMCQTACLDQTRLPDAVNSPAFCSLRQTSLRLQRIAPNPREDSLDHSYLLGIRLKSGLPSALANRDVPVSEWSTGHDIQ